MGGSESDCCCCCSAVVDVVVGGGVAIVWDVVVVVDSVSKVSVLVRVGNADEKKDVKENDDGDIRFVSIAMVAPFVSTTTRVSSSDDVVVVIGN